MKKIILPQCDLIIMLFLITYTFLAIVCQKVNGAFFHNENVNLLNGIYLLIYICSITCYILGLLFEHKNTFFYYMKYIGIFIFSWIMIRYLACAIITTPFAPHDQWLYHANLFFGYHQKEVLSFIHHHKMTMNILRTFYNSLDLMLAIIPFSLLVLGKERAFYRSLCYFLLSFFIGACIYYFFPSTDPSAVTSIREVSIGGQMMSQEFYAIHHNLPIERFSTAIISMPSFHTIWVMIATILLWEYKKARYIALTYSMIVIVSALLIADHYFIDIVAGLLLSGITWQLVIRLFPNECPSPEICKNSEKCLTIKTALQKTKRKQSLLTNE